MAKPILISGIQPTGKIHLGNYLGALNNFVKLQNSSKYQCYFFIADLHSLTEDFKPKEKLKQILNLAADYLAIGLDPAKSVIFIQSSVPAHTELAIILNNFTPLGELKRMTQFKDKSETAPYNINAGLFNYPVLMAADILLYDAEYVPVGDDQLQHLELTRTLARKFNSKFGKTFVEPKPLLTEISRLMSLDDPSKKMSKSRPAGCLFLDDPPKIIKEKIMKAITDSEKEIVYNPQKKPGISNLMLIYKNFSGLELKEIESRFANKGYAFFKKELAELLIKNLQPFQKRKEQIAKNTTSLIEILKKGNKKAESVAFKKITEVKKKIGLLNI